ncbi:hypothetical protein [Methylobacterium sp. Leaf123]|uniref:hypothetical protein n=1 Tax=Methylobacterium sp. Leaf123 TaxID=1736264 RepID=UPI00256FBAA9|nr:hypothetical protein [Methylobacterium sp. Leaf123]
MFEGDEHPFVISDLDTFVDVIGCAEGDKWLEKIEWDENDHFKVQLPTPKTMDFSDLRGWLVKDEGISKLYPRDSVVFCRPESNPDLIGNFDRVLVVRENDNGLFEITIREIAKYKDIVINLRSHARDPDQIRSFDLKPLRLGPGIKSMRIVGVVVASFALEPYRDPAPSPGWE